MRTIWKFPLNWGSTTVSMPVGAEVIHAAMQGDQLCAWAVVDPSAGMSDRVLVVYGTGHEMLPQGRHRHIGSFLVDNDKFVFHVFEIEDDRP